MAAIAVVASNRHPPVRCSDTDTASNPRSSIRRTASSDSPAVPSGDGIGAMKRKGRVRRVPVPGANRPQPRKRDDEPPAPRLDASQLGRDLARPCPGEDQHLGGAMLVDGFHTADLDGRPGQEEPVLLGVPVYCEGQEFRANVGNGEERHGATRCSVAHHEAPGAGRRLQVTAQSRPGESCVFPESAECRRFLKTRGGIARQEPGDGGVRCANRVASGDCLDRAPCTVDRRASATRSPWRASNRSSAVSDR